MYAYGLVFLFIFIFIFIYLILEVEVPIHPLFSLADFIFYQPKKKKETETERLSLMHKLFRNAAVPIPFLHLLSFLLFCCFLLLLLLFLFYFFFGLITILQFHMMFVCLLLTFLEGTFTSYTCALQKLHKAGFKKMKIKIKNKKYQSAFIPKPKIYC